MCSLRMIRSKRPLCRHGSRVHTRKAQEKETGKEDKGHHPFAGHDVKDGWYAIILPLGTSRPSTR